MCLTFLMTTSNYSIITDYFNRFVNFDSVNFGCSVAVDVDFVILGSVLFISAIKDGERER